ncbi:MULTISPECIES: alpha/beta hydrolase [unclassified Nocardia]|uniref:alpha/beta hydrolase n=1 Tax=unclassified Nocardia TaxID=2637762 RepID=UPI00278C4A5F|nr:MULTISPECIES: alpha/beta hydrolase [unclassified Nocardia]
MFGRLGVVSRLGRSRFPWLVALAAVLAGLGAVPVPAAADAVDNHVDELAEAAATPVLRWNDCGDGFECASAAVPLDYHRPRDEGIELAVIKLPAADPNARIGTLFVNFGGPGASGVDRLRERARWPWLFSAELRARFDIVSWDPRAVARSAAARCFPNTDAQLAFLGAFPAMPGDPAGEAEFYSYNREFAERCARSAGPILRHASTANTARDLELLRRAVGDPRLTYHGISYGTLLGATYANMFPGRVRAMAFDGSMDFQGSVTGHGTQGTTMPLDARQDVATGIAETFDAFLRQCAQAGPNCAFSAGFPGLKWRLIAERARFAPIQLNGYTWTYSAIVNAASDLSRPSTYPELAELLQSLFDAVFGLPGIAPVSGGANYTGNRTEAFFTTQCVDSTVPTDLAVYSRAAVTEDRRVPYFGRIGVFDMMACAFWQAQDADRYTGSWNRRTAAPILVLNSRFDPATPLAGAYAGAAQLADARVVVVEGTGHSSMYVPSTCAERVKREYLFTGELPPVDTRCEMDRSPFDPA